MFLGYIYVGCLIIVIYKMIILTGGFLLTDLLLDLIKAASPSRIINVSSMAHKWATINFDDIMSEKNYSAMSAYGMSKLANILFMKELAERLEGNIKLSMLNPPPP